MTKRKVVVFSGSGLSAESGIPTFRGNGLWDEYPVHKVASHTGWHEDREYVLKFYERQMGKYSNCSPNAAHKAIASLQEKFDVYNITQNIDTLLEDAGCENVRHLHGSMKYRKCEWHNDIKNEYDMDNNFNCDYKVESSEPVKFGDTCPKCCGQMRPDIVWFEEAVDDDYENLMKLCGELSIYDGVFICVGTSLEVYPAASMVRHFSHIDKRYIIDPSPKSNEFNYKLLVGKAGDKLPELAEELLSD